MKQQFPNFHLEDKVNLEARGVVRPPIIHQYKRKGRKVNTQEGTELEERNKEKNDVF